PHADDASPTVESPGYIVDSDSMGEDDVKDPEEDPSEEHEPEDDDKDPNEEHEPEDKDTKEEEPFEGFDETEPFKEDETATIARAADRAEDVGYVRALQASEHRMMTFIKEVNLRISYQAQIRRQESKLEINVVRGHRTVYETELQEVRQVCLSFEARNRALLVRLETLETHMSRVEWQRQSTEDLAVTQMMHIHTLEARARTDTVKDAGSSLSSAAAARAPRGQYDFIDTVEAGHGLIRSPGHDAQTIARAADRAEDVGYVKAL
nr:hypothetical protein [Tanacetum cinerariifolium]